MPFLGPKYPNLSQAKYFGTNHYYYFHSPIGPFHWAKVSKNSYSGSRVMTMYLFWAQNGPFLPNIFFLENYWYHSHLPIIPFHCAKFKKNSSSRSRIMRMHNICAQKGPIPQIRLFLENLLISLVSFIHVYLHAKNQSQMFIY